MRRTATSATPAEPHPGWAPSAEAASYESRGERWGHTLPRHCGGVYKDLCPFSQQEESRTSLWFGGYLSSRRDVVMCGLGSQPGEMPHS